MNTQDLSFTDARLLVLEMSVAALIAHLPSQPLEEVASMLCFVADVTEEAEEIAADAGERQLGYVRHWASEMLNRVLVSRKAAHLDALSPAPLPA